MPAKTELTLGYSPWGNGDSIYPFDEVFTYSKDCKAEGFEGIDAFLLWGGTDIHPSFYGQKHHHFNHAPVLPSDRDVWEWGAMRYCKAKGIPIIGVCRGAQFLCAFAGGKLIQHVTGHGNDHLVVCKDGEMFNVTSSHHQMLDVTGTSHELLAWTYQPRSTLYYGEENETPEHLQRSINNKSFQEPEIVYFPKVKGLAIQGHPEWAEVNSRFVAKTNDMIISNLLIEKVW